MVLTWDHSSGACCSDTAEPSSGDSGRFRSHRHVATVNPAVVATTTKLASWAISPGKVSHSHTLSQARAPIMANPTR
jgi:hypothetical protein